MRSSSPGRTAIRKARPAKALGRGLRGCALWRSFLSQTLGLASRESDSFCGPRTSTQAATLGSLWPGGAVCSELTPKDKKQQMPVDFREGGVSF